MDVRLILLIIVVSPLIFECTIKNLQAFYTFTVTKNLILLLQELYRYFSFLIRIRKENVSFNLLLLYARLFKNNTDKFSEMIPGVTRKNFFQ